MRSSFPRLLLAIALVATGATANPVVTLPSGTTVTGLTQPHVGGNSVNVFRGIRYTDAPIGDKRWTQSKLKPLEGAVDATAFGSVCHGDPRYDPTHGLFPFSEDCLFLNVYAPAGATPASKMPVMVWIHGGAFVSGSSSAYDASNVIAAANDQLIVVTLNYRLGVFGFLSTHEILQQGDGANFAFRDQEIAFQWVRQYITHFGGDAQDVTAFGESVGAISVAMHMVSRGGDQKLFDKAILESGAYTVVHDVKTLTQQREFHGALAGATGCAAAQGSVLACLRQVNASAIFDAGGMLPWRPTVDGVFLRGLPVQRVLADKVSRIPVINGVNTDEGYIFTFAFANPAAFDTFLRVIYPLLTEDEYARVAALYPANQFATPQQRVGEIFGDVAFVCPSELLSSKLAAHASIPTYRYRFNQTAPVQDANLAVHTAEIDYVFNNVDRLPKDKSTTSLVAAIQTFWTNFAKTANPNSDAAKPLWPQYNELRQQIVLQTDNGVETAGAYMPGHEERCAFWQAVDLRIASEETFFG